MTIKGLNKELDRIMIGTSSPLFADETSPQISTTLTKEEQFKAIDEIWEMGLHTFDCAASYGEKMLGEYLASRNHTEEAVILTKCCHPNHFRKRVTTFDMLSDLYDSLAKLHRDYLDIFLLHRDDPDVPVSVIMDALNDLKDQGKIRVFGASNWTLDRIREANDYAAANGLEPMRVISNHYSLAHQVKDPWGGGESLTGPEHAEYRKWITENEITEFAYSSMSGGFISGMFRSDDREAAEKLLTPPAKTGYYAEENFERLKRAEKLASEKKLTVAQVAMAWLFNQDMRIVPIQGGMNSEMYRDTLKTAEIKLTAEEVKWLNLES